MHTSKKDPRIVLTLDAGGTNFDFSAVQNYKMVGEHFRMPSRGDDLPSCIQTIVDGFKRQANSINGRPFAISFAFPGPADYKQGIIGDLNNLPAFRGGIPLKSILEAEFGIPVFINNDGDLFVYGEALAGILPRVNSMLAQAGNPKTYSNLVGVTLGTGFGGGFVSEGKLFRGDNSMASEFWLSSAAAFPGINADEALSIRAVKRDYATIAGIAIRDSPEPKVIADIAKGIESGKREAAIGAYRQLGLRLGDVLANLISFFDGLVVIGGGIAYAHELFFPAMFEQFVRPYDIAGEKVVRLIQKVFNLTDEDSVREFLKPNFKKIGWEGLPELFYDPNPYAAVGITDLGTRNATSIGAYAFALSEIDSLS